APSLPDGLILEIDGYLTSRPYVAMTLEMMAQCGISHSWVEDVITISSQDFKERLLYIEPDWSAASYWYSMVALSDHGKITLPGLRASSLQGDQQISLIMEKLGVSTTFTEAGIMIEKKGVAKRDIDLDLINCPDLAQTLIVCCAALGINATFKGLETLKIKETDRVLALQNELSKMGFNSPVFRSWMSAKLNRVSYKAPTGVYLN
ncbi:MAG: hypothetical protein EOP49_41120, partial [Sphingobacteriales bacterium]